MAARREVQLEAGTKVQLTSLRTSRPVECRIDEQLGEGGTAKVYAGTLEDGGQVVIKAQRYEGQIDPGLELEVKLFKQVFHRNVVQCVGVGLTGTGHLLVAFRRVYKNPLLLMANENVDQAMRRDKKARYPSLTIDTAIDLGYELLNALAYLEKLGFVHHDVKLANLLIDVPTKDRPLDGQEVFGKVVRRLYRGVLIDLGAARSRTFLEAWNRGEAPEGSLAPQATPYYAPPEAIVETRLPDGRLGVTYDPSIDVYAAALVLYAMVTGHPPYSHLRTPPDPNDLESVIAAKSAERRGEVETISLEVVQRVVFEDTRFVSGDRHAFDLSFFRFLGERLAPEPAKRGTAAQMKKDFEKLMCIKAAKDVAGGDPAESQAQQRVGLPFTQELVRVGSGGEHPLLRAARAYGLDKPTQVEVPSKIERDVRPGDRARALDDEFMDEIPAAPAAPAAAEPAPPRPAPPAPAARPASGPPTKAGARPPEPAPPRPPRDVPTPPGTRTSGVRRIEVPPGPPAAPKASVRPPEAAPGSRDAPAVRTSGVHRIEAAPGARETPGVRTSGVHRIEAAPGSRDTPPPQSAGGPPAAAAEGTQTRSASRRFRPPPPPPPQREPGTRSSRPGPPGGEERWGTSTHVDEVRPKPVATGQSPLDRPRPPAEHAKAPHCLVSPVLDQPYLLSRERTCVVGRDPGLDVRIKSGLVSRRHAEVHWKEEAGFQLTDLGSVNGTFVNGHRLSFPCLLHDGDRLSFGGFEVTLRVLTGGELPDEESGDTRVAADANAFSGDLRQLPLHDAIELLEARKHSGTIRILLSSGPIGQLVVDAGQLVHAEAPELSGTAAAVKLLALREGRFEFTLGKPRGARTIQGGNAAVWAACGPAS